MICIACKRYFHDVNPRMRACLACRTGGHLSLRGFWTGTKSEQDTTLLALPLEPGKPLTDEEKREMEGAGL